LQRVKYGIPHFAGADALTAALQMSPVRKPTGRGDLGVDQTLGHCGVLKKGGASRKLSF
jgi:hypothetical protein